MATAKPLRTLDLRARSNVEDLALVALMDAATVLQHHAPSVDVRLIGGLMMEVHRLRWCLGPDLIRETRDADFGAPLLAGDVFEDVELGLGELGYQQTGQYRYERVVTDMPDEVSGRPHDHRATLDIVQVRPVPLDAAPRVQAGSGDLDPGAIVEALSRPAVEVRLELTRRNGVSRSIDLRVADEASAVILKAYAWRARRSPRDVYDLWRAFAFARAAGRGPEDFETAAGRAAAAIIREAFEEPLSPPIELLAASTGTTAAVAHTRVTAVRRTLGL